MCHLLLCIFLINSSLVSVSTYLALQQFDFYCDPGPMGTPWSHTADNFAVPDGADLTTPTRTTCGLCTRLPSSARLFSRYDNVTHCVGKPVCNIGM